MALCLKKEVFAEKEKITALSFTGQTNNKKTTALIKSTENIKIPVCRPAVDITATSFVIIYVN